MQRLPNIYPSNTTLYPSGRGTIALPSNNAGTKIVMYNETPLNYDLDFLNGTSDVLHAWEANYWTLDGNVDEIDWQIDVDSLNVTNPPINAIFLTVYEPTETLRDKTYPMALVRQLGGPAQLTSSNSLVNTGNPGGTSVINVNDPIAATITADNDGQLTWLVKVGAALVQFLKSSSADNPLLALGAAAHLVEILGNAKVDGTLTLPNSVAYQALDTGAVARQLLYADSSNNTVVKAAGGNIAFRDVANALMAFVDGTALRINGKKIDDIASNNLLDFGSGGLYAKGDPATAGPMHFQSNGVNTDWTLTAISRFTGTGSGTFSHGLTYRGAGVVPDIIIPITSVAGSQTMGYDTLTTTQVHITTGAALAWVALALKVT